MELSDFTGLALVPVLVALGEMAKRLGLPARGLPLIVVALGIGFNLAIASRTGADPLLAILLGLVVGLTASGLYSSTKSLAGR